MDEAIRRAAPAQAVMSPSADTSQWEYPAVGTSSTPGRQPPPSGRRRDKTTRSGSSVTPMA